MPRAKNYIFYCPACTNTYSRAEYVKRHASGKHGLVVNSAEIRRDPINDAQCSSYEVRTDAQQAPQAEAQQVPQAEAQQVPQLDAQQVLAPQVQQVEAHQVEAHQVEAPLEGIWRQSEEECVRQWRRQQRQQQSEEEARRQRLSMDSTLINGGKLDPRLHVHSEIAELRAEVDELRALLTAVCAGVRRGVDAAFR